MTLVEEHTSLIRRWKPWEHATGPKTSERTTSAMRGYKGAERQSLRELRRAMRDADAVLTALQTGAETA